MGNDAVGRSFDGTGARSDYNLEVEPPFYQAMILLLVEAEQFGGTVGDVSLDFAEVFENVHAEDLLAKVAFVELAIEHAFVEML